MILKRNTTRLVVGLAGTMLIAGTAIATSPEAVPPGTRVINAPDLTGAQLLGLDGSRVTAAYRIEPLVKEGKLLVPAPWPNRVDMPLYDQATEGLSEWSRYVFEQAGRGWRVVRVESIRAPDDENPAPSVQTVERFRYDSTDRLVAWGQWQVSETGSLEPSDQRCFRYRDDGKLVAYLQGAGLTDCDRADAQRQADEVWQAVYDDKGALLRLLQTLPARPSIDGTPGKPRERVTLYRPEGESTAYIETDNEGQPVQRAIRKPTSDYEFEPGRIKLGGVNFRILVDDGELPGESFPVPHAAWSIVRLGPVTSWQSDASIQIYEPQKVLAKGKTDKKGFVNLTPALQATVWQEVQAFPGRVFIRIPPRQPFELVVAYPADRWAHCLDSTKNTEADCTLTGEP